MKVETVPRNLPDFTLTAPKTTLPKDIISY